MTDPAPPSTPTLRGNVRAMPRTIWVLLAGTFINRFGTFVLPFLVLYLRDLGYSAPQGGIAVAMYGVGGIADVGIGGLLADRIGRRNSVALSMFGSAAATLQLPLVTWDAEQRQRAARIIQVVAPEELR